MSDMDTTPHTLQEVALTRSEKIFRSRYGLWGLGFISYIESALIVPIVTDPFLIAFILANRPKAFIAVIVAILTSVLGGLTAYVLAALFAAVLLPFLGPESLAQFNAIAVEVQAETFVLTILGALTPVPYTLVAMAARSNFTVRSHWVSDILVWSTGGRTAQTTHDDNCCCNGGRCRSVPWVEIFISANVLWVCSRFAYRSAYTIGNVCPFAI